MTIVAIALSMVLLGAAGVFRAAGASLLRTPRADALHDGATDPGAATVALLLEDRLGLQPAIGIVHSAFLIAASLPVAWAVAITVEAIVPLVASLVAWWLIVLFAGDAVPRALGRRRPRQLAYRFARLLKWAVSIGGAAHDLIDEEDEVRDESEEHDADDQSEIALISSVLDFSETLVREVMTPRPDMVSIDGTLTSDEALDTVIEHGFSRIPAFGEGLDDVRGIVYAKDLLKLMDEGTGASPLSELMRPAYFVPETKRIPELLRDMQANQLHMAIVVDEFGGTAGLVTIEDLLEELVGEIADEYDREEPMVKPGPNGSLLVDGRLVVEELSELMATELPDEDWDTVGGLMLGLAGRVPREGESFEIGPLMLTCLRVQGRRVAKVRVERIGHRPAAEHV
ncbi:MAG: hemolysin family protein [Acidimicrobiia bacterium]|nr:hemolysin family protein [Acidimicrobiia bacterium]